MSNLKYFGCRIELKHTNLKFHLAKIASLDRLFKKIDCKENSFSTEIFNLNYFI